MNPADDVRRVESLRAFVFQTPEPVPVDAECPASIVFGWIGLMILFSMVVCVLLFFKSSLQVSFQTSFIEKAARVFHCASFQIIMMDDVGSGKDVHANVGLRYPVSLPAWLARWHVHVEDAGA